MTDVVLVVALQLILTSKPRLIYIDPIRMKQKGAALRANWEDAWRVGSKY